MVPNAESLPSWHDPEAEESHSPAGHPLLSHVSQRPLVARFTLHRFNLIVASGMRSPSHFGRRESGHGKRSRVEHLPHKSGDRSSSALSQVLLGSPECEIGKGSSKMAGAQNPQIQAAGPSPYFCQFGNSFSWAAGFTQSQIPGKR